MSTQKVNKREKFAAAAQAQAEARKTAEALKVPAWWAYIPALVAVVVYLNTLSHGFALDDYAAIIENADTRKGLSAIGEIFSTSYRHGYILIADELYRPLPKALFALCWQIAPDSAAPGHLLNVLLFGLTVFMMYRLVLRWWPAKPQVAFVSSLLFAVLPVHTEVVANIKSLDEILALLFGLISLERFHRYHQSGQRRDLLVSMGVFFLAYLSKESSITLLPVFPLSVYLSTDSPIRKVLNDSWYALLPTVLFLVIRYQVLYSNAYYEAAPPAVADNMLMAAKDPFLRLTSAVGMMGYYLASIFFPVNLTFDMSYPQVTPMELSDWRVILSSIVLLTGVAFALIGLKKRTPESLALLFFFCTVSVSSNIFMLIGTHYGERLMYMPSFGLVLLFAMLLQRIPAFTAQAASQLRPAMLALVVPVTLVFALLTTVRNPVWANNGTLYASGLTSAPNSVRVQYYQGLYLGKPETIESYPAASRDSVLKAAYGHLLRATELYPFFTDSWTQLGVISHRDKQPDQALRYYAKARECNPNDPVIINNAATVLFEQKKYNEAMQGFMDAVRLKPDYADALMNIGSCYGLMGNYREALTWFDKAIAVDPGLAQAYFFSAVTWERLGNPTRAAELFRKAEELKAAAPRKN